MGLPEDHSLLLALFSISNFPNLSEDQAKDALALLNKYPNLFASGPSDFGLAKGVIHQIDTGNAPPSRQSHTIKVKLRTLLYLKN